MVLPFLIFWFILLFGREELGWKGVGICVAIWGGLLAGFLCMDASPYVFVAAQALLDCILLIVAFRGNITIR